jgi:hypothetical protein
VIGDIAAAVGAMKLDARAFKQLRLSQQMFIVAVAAHGHDVGMFHDEQLVGNLTALAALDELLLQREGVGVAHAAEIAQLADGSG